MTFITRINPTQIVSLSVFFVFVLVGISFFDKALAIGLVFLTLLIGATVWVLLKKGVQRKEVYLLFFLVLLIHLAAVLFVHYANFQPFSGGSGDYIGYQLAAEEIANRVTHGNFSLEDIRLPHYYPVIIGYIYALTMPAMLIGQLFNVWVSAIAILFLYFIVLEFGVSHKRAFIVGLIGSLYPSFIFFSSLLLKDTIVVVLALAGLYVLLKLFKNFSWKTFLLFYIILVVLIDFRLYIGFILGITFMLSWFFFSRISIKKRFLYALILLPLLGTAPQITGDGYYGIDAMRIYASPQKMTFYKEIVYNPVMKIAEEDQGKEDNQAREDNRMVGFTSSVELKTGLESSSSFVLNFLKSFFYVLFGPIPGQLKEAKHLFALFEMIPWYVLLFFIGKGILSSFRKYRVALPLLIFAFGTFIVLTLYISNFGIITRIRMPAFFVLLPFITLAFSQWQYDKSKDTASPE